MTVQKLSELEGICLGLVSKHQPCTAYQVRQKLKAAPSSHWRASAGSVYPLLERLQNDDLLVAVEDAEDGRGRKLLSITRGGKTSLRKWLLAGTTPELIFSVTDPVRSRMFFLSQLTASQRHTYLVQLLSEMERYFQQTSDYLKTLSPEDDIDGYLGALGAERLAKARLKWVQEVFMRLESDSS